MPKIILDSMLAVAWVVVTWVACVAALKVHGKLLKRFPSVSAELNLRTAFWAGAVVLFAGWALALVVYHLVFRMIS